MEKSPVPQLNSTVEKFLQWSSPFLNEAEKQETALMAEQFEKSAITWQENLIGKQKNQHGWLYDDWIDSYLQGRDPLTLSTNFALEIFPGKPKNLDFLNQFIFALGKQVSLWQQDLYPKQHDNRGNAVDMSQFAILGGICRLACQNKDEIHQAKNSRHIAVYYQDVLYKADILDADFHLSALPDINSLLESTNSFPKQVISSVSFMPRDEAAALTQVLRGNNQAYFDTIENALFVITLVDESMTAHDALFLKGKHGWAAKSMHFVYGLGNRTLWANFEHTYQDAGTLKTILQYAQEAMEESASHINKVNPIPILNVLTENQQAQLKKWQGNYQDKANQIHIRSIACSAAESLLHTFSIDVLTQLVHVFALLRVQGKPRGIYEAVAIPHFDRGRTECVRPLSIEMLRLAEALLNEDDCPEKLNQLIEAAIKEHKTRIKACKQGLGVDRHLMGLKLAGQTERNNENYQNFFQSKAFLSESENFFSTSSLGETDLTGVLIYNPVEPNGYGVAYGYHNNTLLWHFSYSKNTEPEAELFENAFSEALMRAEKANQIISK